MKKIAQLTVDTPGDVTPSSSSKFQIDFIQNRVCFVIRILIICLWNIDYYENFAQKGIEKLNHLEDMIKNIISQSKTPDQQPSPGSPDNTDIVNNDQKAPDLPGTELK